LQDYPEMSISARFGVAIREFPRTSGHADHMLYVD
jgi:hypothetical protein